MEMNLPAAGHICQTNHFAYILGRKAQPHARERALQFIVGEKAITSCVKFTERIFRIQFARTNGLIHLLQLEGTWKVTHVAIT